MNTTNKTIRAVFCLVACVLLTQSGCLSLPEDFWANKFGEIVNGTILSIVDPIVDNFLTQPINTALGG